MGLLRMFKHRRDAKGDRKRLTKQYESTTSNHYHYNHNHSNDNHNNSNSTSNFGNDENYHSTSRHESNAYSFRTLDDTDDVNYYSDPEQQHYFSNGNSHNNNNNNKSQKTKKRLNAKKRPTSNQGFNGSSNSNHSNHNNRSEFNDAWDTDFPYLSHASSSPHHNDNNNNTGIHNNSNFSWSDQFHGMEASPKQQQQQQQQFRPSYQGGGEGGNRPMYNENFNSKNQRMRSQKDVMYPDSTDSELSDYEKAGKPHMIASAFDDDDDNVNEEREDDHLFMFGDFGKKSTSHATKAAVGRGGNRSSNNHNGFFGSISLPDHTAMIRSQYASQFKQRPMTTDTSLPGTIITSSTTPGGSPSVISSNRSCASSSRISSRSQRRRQASRSNRYDRDDSGEEDVENENFIKEQIEGTIGQMGFAADHESISGWSRKSGQSSVGGRSHRSLRSHRSRKSKSSRVGNNYGSSSNIYASASGHNMNGVVGCDQLSSASGHSRRSRGSKSVSKELTRLEHLLANVVPGMSPLSDNVSQTSGKREAECDILSFSSRATGRASHRSHIAGALHDIQVPPGKLGVILANNERGTVVSRVRLNSELFGKIFESDRIMAIDGEDVSKFPYDVIISIMNRKADYERLLTVLRPQETIARVNNTENSFNAGENYFDGRQHMFPN